MNVVSGRDDGSPRCSSHYENATSQAERTKLCTRSLLLCAEVLLSLDNLRAESYIRGRHWSMAVLRKDC